MSLTPQSLSGWHPEDVKAAVRKTGITLSELALRNGHGDSYLRNTLMRPLFDGEQIIARHLGIAAHIIWPDRYDPHGSPDYAKWRKVQVERALANRKKRRAA